MILACALGASEKPFGEMDEQNANGRERPGHDAVRLLMAC
jgi:hypothetical protein